MSPQNLSCPQTKPTSDNVEIHKCSEKPMPKFYQSLFDAQYDIKNSIEVSFSNKDVDEILDIQIIGGRFRTIYKNIFQGILEKINNKYYGDLRNVRFTVWCLDPYQLEQWNIPYSDCQNEKKIPEKFKTQADELRRNITRWSDWNKKDDFKRKNISLDVRSYKGFPDFYGFVIGDSDVFLGPFTWNIVNEDFDGPMNPCMHFDSGMEEFCVWQNVLFSKLAFYYITSTEDKAYLSFALDANRRAYQKLASEFHTTEDKRSQEIQDWLNPVLVQLRGLKNPLILDIGAGDGLIAEYFAQNNCNVTAIDFAHSMCQRMKSRHNLDIIEDEFLKHDFEKKKFRCIVAVAFIHLFPPPWDFQVIKKIHELLDNDGFAFFATTIHDQSAKGFLRKIGYSYEPIRYRSRYTELEITTLLEQAGFKILNLDRRCGPVERNQTWISFLVTRDVICQSGRYD